MSHFITYLTLGHSLSVEPEAIAATIRKIAGPLQPDVEIIGGTNSLLRGGFVVLFNERAVSVMVVDRAVPRVLWQDAAQIANGWPGETEAIATAQAHIIVTLLDAAEGHAAAVIGAKAVTIVSGALAHLLPVQTVLLVDTKQLVAGETVVKMAAGLAIARTPVAFWTRITVATGPDLPGEVGSSVGATTGLLPFIGRELELGPMPLSFMAMHERVLALSQYLIANGPVIDDGEAVGFVGTSVVRARHVAEGRRAGVPALSLTLEPERALSDA